MADFMKVDMSRLGQAEGRSADSGMAAPSGADVDTFQQAMRRRPLDERQGSGGDESDGGRGASHAPDEDTSAEAEALSSMFSRMTGPLDTLFAGRTAQTAETAAPSGDAPDLGALAEKLVERILVSGPDGGHEIRLPWQGCPPRNRNPAPARERRRAVGTFGDGQRGILSDPRRRTGILEGAA